MIACRDAAPEDAAALDDMARAVWLETFGDSVGANDAALYLDQAYGPAGRLIADLTGGHARFRLATEGERIVGYAKINPPWLAGAEAGAIQLSQLYVTGDHHGKGTAATLMDWATQTARAGGAPALLLTVWEENHRAIRFYEKRGFVHIGDYAFTVGNQVDRDMILRLAL